MGIAVRPEIIVLAGGASSRFIPFNMKPKSLFRLMGKTILEHTLDACTKEGMSDATVVLPEGMAFPLPSVKVVTQPAPLGQADAILTAWRFMDKPSAVIVLNAQHVTASTILPKFLSSFARQKRSMVLVQKTDSPWKYGIVETKGDSVVRVVEKPAAGTEPSSLRIVGMYCLTEDAIDTITALPPSEYQLEEGLNLVARRGKLAALEVYEEMPTLKYPWDLFGIKDLLLMNDQYIDHSAFVHKTAIIEGPCWVGPRAVVGAFCVLRKGVILEEGAEVQRYVEAKNVIVGKDSHVHSGFIGDSVIGEHCRIGAGFITANRRFDRRNILIEVKGGKVDTGLSSLGAFIGDHASIGIHCGSMPGTVIAPQTTVWPDRILRGTISSVGTSVNERRGTHVL